MNKIKAIIVEDESSGMKNLLLKLQEYCHEIEVVATCDSGKKAIEMINRFRPEVVFLDIRLGDMTGFDVLQAIPFTAFEVIITTSHNQYAIQAIKKQALDFLTKPIKKEDLVDAVQKLVKRIDAKKPMHSMIGLPVSSGEKYVDKQQILYIESHKSRCQAVVLKSLNRDPEVENIEEIPLTKLVVDMEQRLARHGFCRPNQQYVVNLRHIQEYIRKDGGWVVMKDGKGVNISPRYKDKFHQCRLDWSIGT